MRNRINKVLAAVKKNVKDLVKFLGGPASIGRMMYLRITAPQAYIPLVVSLISAVLAFEITLLPQYASHLFNRVFRWVDRAFTGLGNIFNDLRTENERIRAAAKANGWSTTERFIQLGMNLAVFLARSAFSIVLSAANILVSPLVVIPFAFVQALRSAYDIGNIIFNSAIMKILRRPIRSSTDDFLPSDDEIEPEKNSIYTQGLGEALNGMYLGTVSTLEEHEKRMNIFDEVVQINSRYLSQDPSMFHLPTRESDGLASLKALSNPANEEHLSEERPAPRLRY